MPKTIAALDGNSLMHRAFHAVPPTMNAPDGTPTNAVFGFLAMFLKFVDTAHPDAVVCAFDAGRPQWRMEAIEQYKATRPPMDPALKAQFPLIERLLCALNVPVIRVDGWEGDDILGTIAARDEALGYRTLLVSGDKDVYQLVSNLTCVVTTKRGITDVAIYGPDEVFERYGVTPEQFPDFLGLKGDASDNIPGVPGVGDKTAAKLLSTYESLEGIYAHIDELSGKQKERVQENRDQAFASRKVATIMRDVDFELNLEEATFPSFDAEIVSEAFKDLRMNAHLTRVLALVGQSPTRTHVSINYEPIKTDDAAAKLIEDAISQNETIGIAFGEPQQESLFANNIRIACSTTQGTAILTDEEALSALARIVETAPFAALDVKDTVQRLFPPDSSLPARIETETLANMRAFDIGLAGYVLNSTQAPYSLDTLAENYLGGALPEAKNTHTSCAIAACAARMLVEPLTDALKREKSDRAYFDIDLPLVGVLATMERTGAAIDAKRLSELGESTKADIDALREQIIEMAGEPFNPDSPKQLQHILFEVLGLKPRKKTQRGFSTDAGVLKELAKDHELPKLILHYRELAKIESTYIAALPRMRAGDGRVHTRFNETVTATGRLSSSDPNLQNIPVRSDFGRTIRECFIPLQKGDLFLSADYSQIELRILAHLSQDEHLVAAFNSGADFHAATAARVFNLAADEITPQLRSRAKAVNFGIVYGQQAYGLSQSLDIPYGEAKEMIDRYFEAYPGVRAYLDKTVEQAQKCGYTETMFGRKRHIPEISSHNATQRGFAERTAMNHPMQGSAADIIKIAMSEVARRLRNENFEAKLMLQVHDELDFSVPENEVERLATMVHDVMQNAASLAVPLVVDIAWGNTWAEAH